MSFWDPILSKLRGSEVASLSFTQEGEDWTTCGMVMALEKGEILIRSCQQMASQGELEAWLAEVRDLPLALGVTSEEVLMRKLEAKDLPKDQLLRLVVPQARPEDFFTQQVAADQGTFMAIIRKNRLNQILEIIPDSNQVVGVYLAPLAMITLAKGLQQEKVTLGAFELTLQNGEVETIDQVENPPENIELSPGEELGQVFTLCYASGLNYLLQVNIASDFNLKWAIKEYMHKRLLTRFGGYVLGGVFLIFLINVFFFFQLQQENERLIQENSSLLSTQERVQSMEAFVDEYQELLNAGNESLFTRFSDELGHLVPPAIQLERLEIRPLFLDEKKSIEKDPSIWITGTSENALAYADWIDRIKGLDWVLGITENAYRQGKFELKIAVKDNV